MIDGGAKTQINQVLNQKNVIQQGQTDELGQFNSSFLMALQYMFENLEGLSLNSQSSPESFASFNTTAPSSDEQLLLQPSPLSFDLNNVVKQYNNIELLDPNADVGTISQEEQQYDDSTLPVQSTVFLLQDYSFKGFLDKDSTAMKKSDEKNIPDAAAVEYSLTANDLKSLKVDINGAEPNYQLNDQNPASTSFTEESFGLSFDTKGLNDDNLHQVNHVLSQEDASQADMMFARLNLMNANSKYNETTQLSDEYKMHPVVEQVKVNVVNAIKENQGELSVQLEPRELGKMQIILNVSKESVTVNIFADKLSTYELLQKNAEQIHQQLQDTDEMDLSTNLNFGYKDFDEEARQNQKEYNDLKKHATSHTLEIPGADSYINGLHHKHLITAHYGSNLLNMLI